MALQEALVGQGLEMILDCTAVCARQLDGIGYAQTSMGACQFQEFLSKLW